MKDSPIVAALIGPYGWLDSFVHLHYLILYTSGWDEFVPVCTYIICGTGLYLNEPGPSSCLLPWRRSCSGSHSVIYVPGTLHFIRDGQTIEVDGASGRVYLDVSVLK